MMKIKEKFLNIFSLSFHKKQVLEINSPDFHKKIYTSFEDAIKEIERRKKDKNLIKKVEDYLGSIPEPLVTEVRAVLFRFIATPQFEIKRFFDISTGLNVKPLFWEYYDDKFHSGNYCKYTLGRLCIHKGIDKVGNNIIKKKTILDFNVSNGRSLKDLRTIGDESLIDFHHKMLDRIIPNSEELLYDGSEWLKTHGGHAENYYDKFLALFLVHGILFENFLLNDEEFSFNTEVFLPAFDKIVKKFGIKPLIVAIAPTEIEGSKFWNSYPHQIEDMI